jgi:hypothetical protein
MDSAENKATLAKKNPTRELRKSRSVGPHDDILGTEAKVKWGDSEWYNATITRFVPGHKEYPIYVFRYDAGDEEIEHAFDRGTALFLPLTSHSNFEFS